MIKHFNIFCLAIIALVAASCVNDDDGLTSVNVGLPTNIDASIILTQNNSGDVTIIPSAENANKFVVDFGDGTGVSDTISPGARLNHTYSEGEYNVTLSAFNIAGEVAEFEKPLVVSFLEPKDLVIDVQIDNSNPFLVRVSATAELANNFEVTFGENEGEDPVVFGIGETESYTYSNIGEYEIVVTALSGGEASISDSVTVNITDPLVLPINFESQTIEYNFNNFGGGEGDGVPVVDNPSPNDVNDSQKVGQYTKPVGSEVWAGTSALLNETINFSSTTTIAVDVYSPQAGVPVLFKIEKEGDADVFIESTRNTTVANEWETLNFTLPDANQEEYSVIALFFNFDTAGTGETYYFDNIRLTNPVLLGLPLGFEEGAAFYSFTEFGGAPTEVVENPDASGINTSPNVAKLLKASGAETWAGSFIDLDVPIDLSISSTLTLKVWSPITDNDVLLKLENPETGAEVEVTRTVNEANEWVEVTFDFSSADVNEDWTRVVFFFDFGTPGSGIEFYFDDLKYVTSSPDALVGTWKMVNEAGSLAVGPSLGDTSWFACDAGCVTERSCYFDDTYTFTSNGDFSNDFVDGETWVEGWQGGSESCAAPVAPHDGSNNATYTFNAQNNTLTLFGEGAYIGLAKAVNAGELPNVAVPSQVTYRVSFESDTAMNVHIEAGNGVFWQYKLVKQ